MNSQRNRKKRIPHTDMEQTVKQAGYPDVQSFAKDISEIGKKLIREYNEELRAWKNQTEQKKGKLEPSKKASVREKLHRYQQESRQQPKQTAKKNQWTEDDEKRWNSEENKFLKKWAALM